MVVAPFRRCHRIRRPSAAAKSITIKLREEIFLCSEHVWNTPTMWFIPADGVFGQGIGCDNDDNNCGSTCATPLIKDC